MKIYIFPADLHGCGHYRLIWPARALQREGHNITIVGPKDRSRMLRGSMMGDRMIDVSVPDDADVMVFQRVSHRYLVQAIALIRRKGIGVVIDIDDDLSCIHPANPAFTALHPRNGVHADHSWRYTQDACDNATLVTVSTPALLDRYARRAPGRVLYNMVPQHYLQVPHADSDVIGWAGSVHSHPTDLQVMGPAPAQLIQAGHRFKIVGPAQGIHQALGLLSNVQVEATGTLDLRAWPLGVSSVGIGVAPLADSRFNAAKSWLKMAEYAAVGVPCVGSPRNEYTRLHKLGVGLLARNPNEWKMKLRTLATTPSLRAELSEAGRKVMAEHTIEGNAWRWLEVWSAAAEVERNARLAA